MADPVRHFAFRHRHHHHHHHHHPEPQPAPTPTPAPPPAPPPVPQPVAQPSWPSFTGNAQLVGTSPKQQVSVWVDPSLGQQGIDNANALLADADRVAALNNSIFGIAAPNAVNVIVFALGGATNGQGGADHLACTFADGGNIEVDASFGAPDRVSSLFMAELSECAMDGQLCGLSTGEALSRWCAMVTADNALADFETATAWVQAGMPDFVNLTDATDQDAVSTGCGMVFLSWLLSMPGVSLPWLAQTMAKNGDSGTLAALYAAVTGQSSINAWPNFQAAIAALPGGVTSDDPFNSLATATASA